MSHVLYLAFGRTSGALLADEEHLDDRRRRKGFRQALHSLVDPDPARRWGLEAFWAGTGSPSLNREAVDEIRRRLRRRAGAAALAADELVALATEVLATVLRADGHRKLSLWYGIDGNDLLRGKTRRGDREIAIRQKKVLEKGRAVLDGQDSDGKSKLRQDVRACLLVRDSAGLRAWHMDASNGNAAFNMDGYEALGDNGVQALGQGLSRLLNNMTLRQRDEGFSPAAGLLELLAIHGLARETMHTTRGCPHVILPGVADPAGETPWRELEDEEARVALALSRALGWEQIDGRTAEGLMDELLKGRGAHEVEDGLFEKARDPRTLDLALRGYKLGEIPRLIASSREGRR